MPNDDDLRAERLTDLGHLSSAVGHHVINAFSAIVSNAEILRLMAESEAPIDPIHVADQIIKSAVEASGVARRLIDYTRPVTAVGDTPISLHKLAASVVEEARAAARPGEHYAANLAPVPPIKGQEIRLRAMLGHLLANAREALPAAGGTIALRSSVDDRGWISLDVEDNGRGMTPDVLSRAVEPFFTTKGGRLGVGLSIANGIWRRHRGTLSIQSTPGALTRVRLSIHPEQAQRLH